MKLLRIFIFIISFSSVLHAQEEELITEDQDSIKKNVTYGLRFGVDLSKPVISFLEDDNKGFEFIADFKFKTNLYAAVEIGYQEKNTKEDYLDFTTDGSYVKIGINYNAYDNWAGMENEVFLGIRYGMGVFNHTLHSYTPNLEGTYFITEELEPGTEFTDLDAHWVSFIVGIKVETFNNLYLGMNVSVNRMINSSEPDNFLNMHVPGFNRVFSNGVGAGFNYSISYLIPLFKKAK